MEREARRAPWAGGALGAGRLLTQGLGDQGWRVRGLRISGPAMNEEFCIFISVLRQDSCLFFRMRLPRTTLFQ